MSIQFSIFDIPFLNYSHQSIRHLIHLRQKRNESDNPQTPQCVDRFPRNQKYKKQAQHFQSVGASSCGCEKSSDEQSRRPLCARKSYIQHVYTHTRVRWVYSRALRRLKRVKPKFKRWQGHNGEGQPLQAGYATLGLALSLSSSLVVYGNYVLLSRTLCRAYIGVSVVLGFDDFADFEERERESSLFLLRSIYIYLDLVYDILEFDAIVWF